MDVKSMLVSPKLKYVFFIIGNVAMITLSALVIGLCFQLQGWSSFFYVGDSFWPDFSAMLEIAMKDKAPVYILLAAAILAIIVAIFGMMTLLVKNNNTISIIVVFYIIEQEMTFSLRSAAKKQNELGVT